MPEDISSLAKAAARIGELKKELDAANEARTQAENRASEAEKARDDALARLADIPDPGQVVDNSAELADLKKKLADANAARLSAEANLSGMAKKFDDLYADVEPNSGVSKCPGYITSDGRHFDNLALAKDHVLASDADIVARSARTGQSIPSAVAARIKSRL